MMTITQGGGGGVLNKCLHEEAPPLGPTSYPLHTIFHDKGTPFVYLLLTNGTPFTYKIEGKADRTYLV